MWQLLLLALAAAKPEPYIGSLPPGGVIVDGVAFGPKQSLTCTWFTNFENSRFERCRGPAGNLFSRDDGASIKCLAGMCERLDAEARKAAHWRKPEPPWGTFSVQLVGRVSLHKHSPQYLGDATNTVLIERIVSVRTSK
jgi:hypothetical protein